MQRLSSSQKGSCKIHLKTTMCSWFYHYSLIGEQSFYGETHTSTSLTQAIWTVNIKRSKHSFDFKHNNKERFGDNSLFSL